MNAPATFSTLKLKTGFDSTSAQSNAALLVSATEEINILASGQDGKFSQRHSCVIITVESVNDPFISRTDKRIIATVTSMRLSVLLPVDLR